MKSEAEVLDNRGFVRWFLGEIRRRLGCADIEVYSALVLAGASSGVLVAILLPLKLKPGNVIITFTCDGKVHIAKIRAKVSLYYRRSDGKVVRVRVGDPRAGAFLIYDRGLGFFNNALIRIGDSTSIEIYELNPIPTTLGNFINEDT